jgi:hypothetical protein
LRHARPARSFSIHEREPGRAFPSRLAPGCKAIRAALAMQGRLRRKRKRVFLSSARSHGAFRSLCSRRAARSPASSLRLACPQAKGRNNCNAFFLGHNLRLVLATGASRR